MINAHDLPDCPMINVYGRHRVFSLAVLLHPQLIKVYGVCLCGQVWSERCKQRRLPVHALPGEPEMECYRREERDWEGRGGRTWREGSGRDTGRSVKGGWREKCEEPEEFAALPPGPMCPSSQLNQPVLAVGCS